MTITYNNSAFDLTYTLTPTQMVFLRDNTNGLNLGNNTLVKNDFSNINISITNGNQLGFKQIRAFVY